MTHVGMDLAKRESQVALKDDEGKIVKEMRIPSTKAAFTKHLAGLGEARVVVESSTSSEWVARHLESMGLEVVVADPNYAPMMGERRKRKVKTDRRDARALAEASRLGAYRPAHRMSDEDRRVRGEISVRLQCIATRTSLVNLVRALIFQYQEPVKSCAPEHFVEAVRRLELPDDLKKVIGPALELIETVNKQLAATDKDLARQAKADPTARRLMTAPGVGPLTALMFIAVIGRASRFHSAAHASAYVGLTPGENSSGDGVRRTRITKTGNAYLRSLLVQCAWSLLRSKAGGGLKQWARRLGLKRTKKVAAIALARRLARVLWAMMKDGTEFDAGLHPERKLEVRVMPVAA